MRSRFLITFISANAVLFALIFGDALWGKSILAPLDIAPAFFSQYRYLDPSSTGIPKNHFIIDQLTYDLPIQHTIYQSYQRREIPWWDPYTFSGRPLLADAHINGTDPFRLLLYPLLPFEMAYNWTLILHTFFAGLAALLFLRYLGFSEIVSLGLALALEFAGSAALCFGHPWIEASFLYYPLVWLLWDKGIQGRACQPFFLSTLFIAAIFYSGNLQSHAYFVLFSMAFLIGYAGKSQREWRVLLPKVLAAALLGASLAAPVLLAQIEFFLSSVRVINPSSKIACLSGILSGTVIFPWMLGTFRTLDLGKFIGDSGLSFRLYIGSAAIMLAVVPLALKPQDPRWVRPRRTAIALLITYLVVLSTPLLGLLYPRCAGLGVLALMILSAIALEEIIRRKLVFPRCAYGLWVFAGLLFILLNLTAFLIYPHVLPKVQAIVQKKSATALDASPALRIFQVNNLPNEISVKNPETLLALLSLVAASFFLHSTRWRKSWMLMLLLLLNLLPPLLFFSRFIPHQPIEKWRLLLAGGPDQRAVKTLLGDSPLRFYEKNGPLNDYLFPNAMSHLYHIRTVYGYSALRPKSLQQLSPAELSAHHGQIADYTWTEKSGLEKAAGHALARFQWADNSSREFQVEDRGLNEIKITFSPGGGGDLIWADTYYPGWTASYQGGQNIPLRAEPPCFSRLHIPADSGTLVLKYRPTYLRLGEIAAFCGLITLGIVGLCSWIKPRKPTLAL